MKALIEKANVLLESLPYIKKFQGRTVVIKYGGNAMVSEGLRSKFAQDIILLRYIGIKPVVVHGGGPQIGQTMERMGKEAKFVKGHRIRKGHGVAQGIDPGYGVDCHIGRQRQCN